MQENGRTLLMKKSPTKETDYLCENRRCMRRLATKATTLIWSLAVIINKFLMVREFTYDISNRIARIA